MTAQPTTNITRSPYPGVDYYRERDKDIFRGRNTEIADCVKMLARSRNSLFILHGNTGCGKSSFLRAGLIPRVLSSHRLKFLHNVEAGEDPNFIRSTGAPLSRFWDAVRSYIYELRDMPAELKAYCKDDIPPNPNVFLWILETLATAAAPSALVFIIDQAEEVFTLSNDLREFKAYFDFLAKFVNAGVHLRLLISMRTEYKGRFDDELMQRDTTFVRMDGYYLRELDSAAFPEAIKAPTQRGEFQGKFNFDDSVIQQIVDDLNNDENLFGGKLPVLQVICRRLYENATQLRSDTIRLADYLGLGKPHDQLDAYIEHALVSILGKCDTPHHTLSTGIDLWRECLYTLVKVQTDGRVTTQRKPRAELVREAKRLRCPGDALYVIGRLTEENWILRPLPECAEELFLAHDALGLALHRWKQIHNAVSNARAKSPLSETISYTEALLFPRGERPERFSLLTIDDIVWDHQLLLFADREGFLNRLGLELHVDQRFDVHKSNSIESLRFAGELPNGAHAKVVALPLTAFPQSIDRGEWSPIAICNVYTGYAAITTSRDLATPPPITDALQKAKQDLKYLYDVVQSGRVYVYEMLGERYISLSLTLAFEIGLVPSKLDETFLNQRVSPQFESIPADGDIERIIQDREDSLFRLLLKAEEDRMSAGKSSTEGNTIIVGPAPTRASALRNNFPVIAAATDLLNLAFASSFEGKEKWVADFCSIFQHNTVQLRVIEMNERDREKLIYRLASIVFYTSEYLRISTEEFVQFIYNDRLHSPSGRPPVFDRQSIRAAVNDSYHFARFDDYGMTYMQSDSRFTSLRNANGTASDPAVKQRSRISEQLAAIYLQLSTFRAECLQLLDDIRRLETSSSKNLPSVADLKEAGWRHFKIFSFYDAKRLLMQAKDELTLAEQRERRSASTA